MTIDTARHRTPARALDGDGPDSVGMYLEEIGRTPLLTAAEEVDLSTAIEAGLYAQHLLDARMPTKVPATRGDLVRLTDLGRQAQDHMMRANLRLVVSLARKYRWSGVPLLDLIQEGNLGLLRAVQKFDYTTGYKFSTYATWWIRQAITRGIYDHARVVRIPANRATEHHRVRRTLLALTDELGREPTLTELADATNLPEGKVKDYLYESQEETSLDLEIGEDGLRLGDVLTDGRATDAFTDVDDRLDDMIRRQIIAAALKNLAPSHAYVLERKNGLRGSPVSVPQIARELGITSSAVRQIEADALTTLRTEKRLLPLASGDA